MEELKYFFSYVRMDSEFVLQLAKELRAVGANLWLDQLDILGGQHWDSTVEKALKSCKGMIAVLSPESVASKNVMDEVSYALDEGKLVVPVLIRSCNIPYRLRRVQYIDFTADYDTGFTQLLRALGIEQPAQPVEPAAAQKPVVQEPSLPKQSELTIDEHKPAKAGSRSRMAKVLAAVCIVALITIISIGVLLKDRQPEAGNVTTNSIGMKLVHIPKGEFKMGSSSSPKELLDEYKEILLKEHQTEEHFQDEFPRHEVRISKGFWMGQTEVTQGQYLEVMNDKPWLEKDNVQEDANNPAVYVSWEDANDFCEKLSKKEGKTYRLPTEAEWEYACRAGKTTRFSFGYSDSFLGDYGDYAWYYGNADGANQKYAHPVGKKKPNPWNLYDMHGNVWEWCSDCYDPNYYKDNYSNSPSVDPKGPSSGDWRSMRGGSWRNGVDTLRCACRFPFDLETTPDKPQKSNDVGFRVVRSQ